MASTRLTLRVTKVGMSSFLRLLSATQCGLTIINVVSTRRCARTRYLNGTHPPFFLEYEKRNLKGPNGNAIIITGGTDGHHSNLLKSSERRIFIAWTRTVNAEVTLFKVLYLTTMKLNWIFIQVMSLA